MDLLKIIKEKSKQFEKTKSLPGIDAVIHHIEIAENHYMQGNSSDEYYYTDVIYRTNQAFEGAVKEAYRVLAGGNPNKKRPYDIEKYFAESNILKKRILSQFSTYRKDWRNKSTHDYQLFFSSQEAVLAIVSVTAFFNILLDQMYEKISFDIEKEKLESSPSKLSLREKEYNDLKFIDQCIRLFKLFSKELKDESDDNVPVSEYELLGRITAFISAIDSSIEITTEHEIDYAAGRIIVDLSLKKGEDELIVELKRPTQEYNRKLMRAKDQLMHYLVVSGQKEGIVYAPVMRPTTKSEYDDSNLETAHGNLRIITITPAVGSA